MFIRDDFIDKYVGFVDPGYVMVYLYISRNRKDALSVNKAASALGIQPATLRKALTFWHQQEELSFFIDGDALKIHSIAYSAKSDAPLPDVSQLEKDPEFTEILTMISEAFPRVSAEDKAKIAHLYSDYHFRKDVFAFLIKYAQEHHAKFPGYMVKIGEQMHQAGVSTAKSALCWADGTWQLFCRWNRLYGAAEGVSDRDIDIFRRWKETYTEEQVAEAIKTTVQRTNKKVTAYTDKVLANPKTSTP